MKKIYQVPEVEITLTAASAMIAASVTIGEDTGDMDGTIEADAPEYNLEWIYE